MTDVMINKEVEVFFTGKPETRALFRAVERKIRAIGPAIITVTKTQISFATRTQFAWIWMPQPTDRKRPLHSLVLSFGCGRQIVHDQIVEAVEPYPGRWTHHVIIAEEADLTDVLDTWLQEAYRFSETRGRQQSSKI
ncbi:MAG TPA: hypothetical protein DCY16_00410 [Trichococcus sp.]|jgi:hypothetical protein|uniref:DUF5655 domain-containing protein n=2 Tax=root TaxID=1 RepID=A0AB38BJM7_9LACT|nr:MULTISPECIES: DUF5655 domain-containing protein [Trichococcus]HAZ58639.1 hypothetical protein [Trichococcus sp.]CZR00717.1 Hypothetical protein TFLO_2562 [Trichococcus flocculiformis]CZR10053.1 Hypothetical protein TES5_2804 [Trichococcus sp. ES5]SFH99147.1 hypothetical protein SAMN04488507_10335 [Trichococcus flocculiformis]SHG17936.1 hypothetical protein SAMN04488048_13517 [Trichococcus flocculiformis]